MKVIEAIWFTNVDGTVGIVVGEDDITGERKAYIGNASGTNEKGDNHHVLDWGNKLSLGTVERIVSLLTKRRE